MKYHVEISKTSMSGLYLLFLPIIILCFSVWSTNDMIGFYSAFFFQIYIILYICIFSFFLFQRNLIMGSALVSNLLFLESLIFSSISFPLSYFLNPYTGLIFLFSWVFILRFVLTYFRSTLGIDRLSLVFINRILIMLCICLMVMLAFWLNPYTEPLIKYLEFRE